MPLHHIKSFWIFKPFSDIFAEVWKKPSNYLTKHNFAEIGGGVFSLPQAYYYLFIIILALKKFPRNQFLFFQNSAHESEKEKRITLERLLFLLILRLSSIWNRIAVSNFLKGNSFFKKYLVVIELQFIFVPIEKLKLLSS